MPEYLLSVHGSDESSYGTPEDMARAFHDVDVLNKEMQSAGVWVFAGGLELASTARVVRVKDGALLHTDGPYARDEGAHRRLLDHQGRRRWTPR